MSWWTDGRRPGAAPAGRRTPALELVNTRVGWGEPYDAERRDYLRTLDHLVVLARVNGLISDERSARRAAGPRATPGRRRPPSSGPAQLRARPPRRRCWATRARRDRPGLRRGHRGTSAAAPRPRRTRAAVGVPGRPDSRRAARRVPGGRRRPARRPAADRRLPRSRLRLAVRQQLRSAPLVPDGRVRQPRQAGRPRPAYRALRPHLGSGPWRCSPSTCSPSPWRSGPR